MYFLEGGDVKVQFFLTFERCEHWHDTSIVDGNQENMFIIFTISKYSLKKEMKS